MLRDRVLRQYFEPSAAKVLQRVPIRYGEIHGFGGMAIGDDPGSRLAGVVLGFGNERQVVIDLQSEDSVVFHEYIHQAQYEGLLDTERFVERYGLLKQDPHYAGIAARWESYVKLQYGQSTAVLALAYRQGLTRELMAYLLEGWMQGWYDLPEYFLDVYRGTVRLEARDEVRRRH